MLVACDALIAWLRLLRPPRGSFGRGARLGLPRMSLPSCAFTIAHSMAAFHGHIPLSRLLVHMRWT